MNAFERSGTSFWCGSRHVGWSDRLRHKTGETIVGEDGREYYVISVTTTLEPNGDIYAEAEVCTAGSVLWGRPDGYR